MHRRKRRVPVITPSSSTRAHAHDVTCAQDPVVARSMQPVRPSFLRAAPVAPAPRAVLVRASHDRSRRVHVCAAGGSRPSLTGAAGYACPAGAVCGERASASPRDRACRTEQATGPPVARSVELVRPSFLRFVPVVPRACALRTVVCASGHARCLVMCSQRRPSQTAPLLKLRLLYPAQRRCDRRSFALHRWCSHALRKRTVPSRSSVVAVCSRHPPQHPSRRCLVWPMRAATTTMKVITTARRCRCVTRASACAPPYSSALQASLNSASEVRTDVTLLVLLLSLSDAPACGAVLGWRRRRERRRR